MLGVDEAGQAQCDAVHLVPVGAVELRQRFEKVRLAVAGRRDAAGLVPVHRIVHDRVFDLGAAHVKDHDLHAGLLPVPFFLIMAKNRL